MSICANTKSHGLSWTENGQHGGEHWTKRLALLQVQLRSMHVAIDFHHN